MKKFIHQNSLSIAFIVLFIFSMLGQIIFGIELYNKELIENGSSAVSLQDYLLSGHFIEATFENWESEFLQMGLFVWLTIFLKQKGSSESKGFGDEEEVDREPSPQRKYAPWPVKKGGIWLKIYQNSLTISLFVLFFASFCLHFYGSLKDENTMNLVEGKPQVSFLQFMQESRFWFESFQNWQSEFLSVFAIIVLSIFLRQKGSSQSKPVDAPNSQTGE
ncbi:DUF6766 family protein [Flavobacterium reichenbachii]|uniref:Uncharacterized protein n=1 Tax=Flavobacterium reichenbachii TaxID=362418 RepID=A0A085ZF05_9FLAO|nr:DUF6766 family protein [Flavobacterium reichenbachii]KFF03019.1 hypothetical protein IW19_23065 [Flavobacterium reichenbachii]OXB17165.1 hypothetical protein B0A68_05040 [Flavobacterium reichenbachii]